MSNKKTKKTKFFRPGTLKVKGTKITLKTQPYLNGILLEPSDPITSLKKYLALAKLGVSELKEVNNIGCINKFLPSMVSSEDLEKIELLLDYLSMSPTEIILKEQVVDEDTYKDIILEEREHQNG